MLNHITIMGRLTRDPELRYTQSQTPVASFTLAVDKRRNAEVVVDNVYFGESKKRDGDPSSFGGSYSGSSYPGGNDFVSPSAPSPMPSGFEELSDDDGELPF